MDRFIDVMTADAEEALRQNETQGLYASLFLAGEAWRTSLVGTNELPRLKRLIDRLDAALRAKNLRPSWDRRLFVELSELFGANRFGIEDTAKLDVHTKKRLQQLVERNIVTYIRPIARSSGPGYWPAKFHCAPTVKWGLILYRMR